MTFNINSYTMYYSTVCTYNLCDFSKCFCYIVLEFIAFRVCLCLISENSLRWVLLTKTELQYGVG